MVQKPKRCRNYDDDGEPTTSGGCRNPNCRFVHPGDREWDNAISTFKSFGSFDRGSFRGRGDRARDGQRSPVSPTTRRGFRKPHDYRDRETSRQRRHSEGSRYSGSPSRSPARPNVNRSSSIASSKNAEAGPSKIEAVALNIDNDSRTNKAPPPLLSPLMTTPMNNASARAPPTGPNTSRLANINRLASTTPITATFPTQSPWADTSAPPPPPPGSAPIFPPPPLPELPKTLTLEVAPPQVEQTAEEKFTLWEERVKGFAASVKAQEQLSELEKEISAARVVIASTYFQTLPDSTRALLTVQLMELITKRDTANEERNRHVDSLVQSGYWPVQPPPASSDTDRLHQDHEEIVGYVKELHETANEMKAILGEMTGLKSPPKLFLPDSSDEELGPDNNMDVDEENRFLESSSSKTLVNKAPLPGRKVSLSQPQAEKVGEQIPTQTELNEVLDRLQRIEAMADTLQSDAIEHDREIIEEFEERIASKVEDINAKQMEVWEARDEKRKKHEATTAAMIKSMKEDVGVTDTQVGELAGDISEMMLKVDRLQAELDKQKAERNESMKRVSEVQRKLNEFKATQKQNSDKIETLKLAVKAYTSRPASPPPTPTIPPPAFILQALEEPLIRAVRTSVQPLVEELRKDVESLIQTKNGELYSTVWDKISGTLRVLDLIRARVNGVAVATPVTSTTTSGGAFSAPTQTLAEGNP